MKILVASLAIIGALSAGQLRALAADEELNSTSFQLMLSLGSVAHSFDMDPLLRGMPRSRAEVSDEHLFQIEPNAAVLAFPDTTVPYGGATLTPVVTEDGQWGLVQLRAGKSVHFIIQATLREMYDAYRADSDTRWAIVNQTLSARDQRIAFTPGEVIQLGKDGAGDFAIVIDPKVPFLKAKAEQITAVRSSNVASDGSGRLLVSAGAGEINKVKLIEFSKFADLFATEDRPPTWSHWLQRIFSNKDDFFSIWPKIIIIQRNIYVTCDMTIEEKRTSINTAEVELKTDINSKGLIKALDAIGITIEAGVALKISKEYTETLSKVIEKQSFDINRYMAATTDGAKLISLGLAEDCESGPGERVRYPYGFVQGIPGAALDKTITGKMENATMPMATWGRESGFFDATCAKEALARISNYLHDKGGIDNRIAKFLASRLVRSKESLFDCPSG